MSISSVDIAHSRADLRFSWAGAIWKEILNQWTVRARAAADRGRLAALPLRHLDDIGMTEAERTAILGCEGQAHDPWALIATRRL